MRRRTALLLLAGAGGGVAGLLAPPLREAVLAGWLAGIALEWLLAALHAGALAGRVPVLAAPLLGFLLRLVLLTGGTVAAAGAPGWPAEGFLLSATVAILCGLALELLTALAQARAGRSAERRSLPDEPHD